MTKFKNALLNCLIKGKVEEQNLSKLSGKNTFLGKIQI